ncbi:unnamed protein product [Trichobilharzia regenti]|nr:unnamed protein product [Trichobilharzia regenti]
MPLPQVEKIKLEIAEKEKDPKLQKFIQYSLEKEKRLQLNKLKELGAIDFGDLRIRVKQEVESKCEHLMQKWYPKVIQLFVDRNSIPSMKPSALESFYRSVSTLLSIQIQTVESWLNSLSVPVFIDAKVPFDVHGACRRKLQEAVKLYFETPYQYFVKVIVEPYSFIFDGGEARKVEEFLRSGKQFEHYCEVS